ncbi:MAG: dipeptide epimerase [Roseiflexaceae bacterium]|nr:dipeptide epimerase [Roseiflexaceae bacterium]
MSTTIRSLNVEHLNIPLLSPFGIAGGTQDVARNLLLTVELADGTRGYGEAAPFEAYNGETQQAALEAVGKVRSIIEGADAREWRLIASKLKQIIGAVGSARCGVETAVLDALTRHARMPLWSFFGGVSTTLETDMTVTTGSVEQAAADARAVLARGISTIKIKIGSGDLAHDVARVRAIAEAAPAAPLMLDGNGGFSADQALQVTAALEEHGITPILFEQPVRPNDFEGLRQMTMWSGVPIAADESAPNAREVLRVALERAAHVVNIKLMKAGIVEALDIAAVCRAAHMRLMIGGNIESILGMTASACFAAGQGGFHYVDLDTPMFMAENPFDGGFVQTGARLDLAYIKAGHGVTPKR